MKEFFKRWNKESFENIEIKIDEFQVYFNLLDFDVENNDVEENKEVRRNVLLVS